MRRLISRLLLVGATGARATGAGSMKGFCALLEKEKAKGVSATIKGRFLWIASLSFVDCFILGGNFLFRFARVRYDLPVQIWYVAQCDFEHILCVDISKQLNQMVW